jgi:hypothetical protein
MNKEFIPYEQALALKELGFDEPCFMFYEQETSSKYLQKGINDEYWGDYSEPQKWNSMPNKPWKPFCQCVSAPTFSQAFRWFREKHELSCSVELTDNSRHYYFDFIIYDSKNRDWNDEDCFDSCRRIYDDGKFGTYEEAELACLIKLIEIVKNK